MKASMVRELGGPEQRELLERERPQRATGEALVCVAACGVYHHDLLGSTVLAGW